MKTKDKDPAIIFYTADFLTGCADLSMKERGQYITMLCLQHHHGHLTKKTIDLNIFEVNDNGKIDYVSETVLCKFSIDKTGNYFNKRLDLEIAKRKAYSKKQQENARKRWSREDKPVEMPSHIPTECQDDTNNDTKNMLLENDNDNENKDININKNIDIFNYIESNFGRTLAPIEIEGINQWKETYDDDVIKYAVDTSVMNSVKKMVYVSAILKNWFDSGYKTINQIKGAEKKYTKSSKENIELYDYDWLNDTDSSNLNNDIC